MLIKVKAHNHLRMTRKSPCGIHGIASMIAQRRACECHPCLCHGISSAVVLHDAGSGFEPGNEASSLSIANVNPAKVSSSNRRWLRRDKRLKPRLDLAHSVACVQNYLLMSSLFCRRLIKFSTVGFAGSGAAARASFLSFVPLS